MHEGDRIEYTSWRFMGFNIQYSWQYMHLRSADMAEKLTKPLTKPQKCMHLHP